MMNYSAYGPEDCDFMVISPVNELPDGERLSVEIGIHQIMIFNISGKFYAIQDLCSHDEGPLGDGDLEGEVIICPRHGARFDINTGKALSLPAVEDIAVYPVKQDQGHLLVGIPREK